MKPNVGRDLLALALAFGPGRVGYMRRYDAMRQRTPERRAQMREVMRRRRVRMKEAACTLSRG